MPDNNLVSIRPATCRDIPRLMEIRAAVRENRLSEPSSVLAADYRRFIDQGCCWVAEELGSLTGFAGLDPQAASLWALFVDPRAERRGIGRALHDRMIREARSRGLDRLTLSTTGGTRAEEFYRRAGWSTAGLDANGDARMKLEL